MSNWRDELKEAVKSKAEREAEENERRQKRVQEALKVADEAMETTLSALRFAVEQLEGKGQPIQLEQQDNRYRLELHDLSLVVELDRETAVLKSIYNEGKPRQFEFAKDRHLAPTDIEEYIGRRLVELARAAQKEHPW